MRCRCRNGAAGSGVVEDGEGEGGAPLQSARRRLRSRGCVDNRWWTAGRRSFHDPPQSPLAQETSDEYYHRRRWGRSPGKRLRRNGRRRSSTAEWMGDPLPGPTTATSVHWECVGDVGLACRRPLHIAHNCGKTSQPESGPTVGARRLRRLVRLDDVAAGKRRHQRRRTRRRRDVAPRRRTNVVTNVVSASRRSRQHWR